jgi:hypothetical protein
MKLTSLLATLALALTITACGGGMHVVAANPTPTPTIGTGGEQYLPTPTPTPSDASAGAVATNFDLQAQALGVSINAQGFTFEVVSPDSISQLSSKLDGNVFYINSSIWNGLTDNCEKEMFLFRELGRWVLNREYINSQSSNVSSSLMDLSGFSCDIYVTNYAYFQRELFTQTYLSFDSNPSYNQKVDGYAAFNALY